MCCDQLVRSEYRMPEVSAVSAWARGLPSGIIDTHVHTAPDVVERVQSDIELTRSATEAGYRAFVLKNHHAETAARAQIANQIVDGAEAFGGIVLNASCGGVNVAAVETAIALGARVVWMPTHSSDNHVASVSDPLRSGALARADSSPVVCPESGNLLPEVLAVLDVIAARDRVLATGHLSAAEIMKLVPEARRRGVSNVIVTHPELNIISLSIENQLELAELGGVWFERVYTLTTAMFGHPFEQIVDAIRAVGTETTIMASDLGQVGNPDAVTGMRAYVSRLRDNAVTSDAVEEMTCINPAMALGLGSESRAASATSSDRDDHTVSGPNGEESQ